MVKSNGEIMEKRTICDLANAVEGQTFDRKSIKIAAKDLAVIVVAFANADGGTVAIGISDDGELEGVDEHQEHVNELLRVPFDFCQPTVRVTVERLPFSYHDGTLDHILLMNVQQSQKVHANQKDEVFYRVDDGCPSPKYEQIAFSNSFVSSFFSLFSAILSVSITNSL